MPARAGKPPSAETLLTAYAGADDLLMAELLAERKRWTAQVLQSHLSYPVLFRFRSLDESGGMERALRQAGTNPASGSGERLDAIRAGYAGRMPALSRWVDIKWHDPRTGEEAVGLR